MGRVVNFLHHTPELVIFFYIFAAMLQGPLLQQYAYSRYSEDNGLVYDYGDSKSTCGNDTGNGTQHEIRKHVQALSARYNVANSFVLTIPSIIACIFYGALSDKVGRKPILLLGICGGIADSIVVVITLWFKLPVYMLYLGNLLNGLTGGYTNLVMCSMAYLSDVTPKEKLAARLSFLQCFVYLGMMLSVLTSGVFIVELGFIAPNVINLGLRIFCFMYVVFLIKESLGYKQTISNSEEKSNDYKEVKNIHKQPIIMFKTFIKERPNRAILFTCFSINIFAYCFTIAVFSVITLYFLNEPFCWTPLNIGYYEGVSLLCIAIGTAVGVKVGYRIGVSEAMMCLLSLILAAGYFFMLAYVDTLKMAFLGLILKTFSGLPSPILNSVMSRLVSEDERGAIFSMVSSSQMLIVFIATFVFNASYSRLNNMGHANYFWFVPTIAMLIPLTLTFVFWRLTRKGNVQYIDMDEDDEERTTMKNENAIDNNI